MNVLSLCDGMSCLQLAMKELGMKVDKYYASEIDKFAIKQTQHNFPNTIQIGSIVDIDVSKLDNIDFIGAGTPCTNFSFAGKRKGMSTTENEEIYTLERYLELKEQGFEFEGESYLFWEFMRILKDVQKYNPDVLFLLENVEMGKKWERVLSEAVGIYGIHINSALVSAQNRKRIYWSNIRTKQEGLFGELHTDIPQPEDRGILLRDILEEEVDEKYFLSEKAIKRLIDHKQRHLDNGDGFGFFLSNGLGKSNTILSRYYKDGKEQLININTKGNIKSNQEKASYFTAGAHSGENHSDMDLICVAQRGRENGQKLDPRNDGKTNTITTVHKDNLLQNNSCIRRLTPTECARLQTIPEWYEWVVSDSQAYKMLGNAWTIEVIKHILSFMR